MGVFYINSNNFDEILGNKNKNIVLCGFKDTGKTTLLIQHLEGFYSKNTKKTIGLNKQIEYIYYDRKLNTTLNEKEYSRKLTHTNGNVETNRYDKYSFTYWDLAGSQKFDNVRTTYMKQANAVILLFSLNEKFSFIDEERENNSSDCTIGKYVAELYSALGNRIKEIPFLVIGTKNDLDIKVDFTHINYIVRKLSESGLNIILWKLQENNKDLEIRFSQNNSEIKNKVVSNSIISFNTWISTSSKTRNNVCTAFKIIHKSLIVNK